MKQLFVRLALVLTLSAGVVLGVSCAHIQRGLTPLVEKTSSHGVYRVHGLTEKIVVLTIDDEVTSKIPLADSPFTS